MAYDSLTIQGKFTSTGVTKTLQIRSDLDWMKVYNYTQAAADNDKGVEFYWQRGMAEGTGMVWSKEGSADTVGVTTLSSGGFTLVDSQSPEFSSQVAITSSTNATQPVFTVGSTADLSTGDVVLLQGISGQTSLNGYEFEIEVLNGTTFRTRYAMANAPGVAGTGGFYRVRLREPLFAPQRFLIGNVTSADPAVITFTRRHNYQVGDDVRLSFPGSAWGNYQDFDEVAAKISAVTPSSITLKDVATSLAGTFGFPLPAVVPFTPASVFAFGGNNSSDDEVNDGYIGIRLGAGASKPAGEANDVIYWVAGKSFSVENE